MTWLIGTTWKHGNMCSGGVLIVRGFIYIYLYEHFSHRYHQNKSTFQWTQTQLLSI